MEIQTRLHRQYGPGLRDLSDPKTPALFAAHPALGQTTVDNGDGTQTINGLVINTKSWKSFPLGLVSGLQYNTNTWGRCFYATLDTVQFADYFEKDLQAFFEEGNFYQIAVYDPLRLSSNLLAVYE